MILYNISILLIDLVTKVGSLFNKKLKYFVSGRKHVFVDLENQLIKEPGDYIWIHCASLGEYILAEPLIESIKASGQYKILVSFFSPSGYEIKKNDTLPDKVLYIPLDYKKNAKMWVKILNPKLAIFSKYDFWINHIDALHEAKVPTVAISCYFYPEQIYFSSYGGFYKKALSKFDHFFVIDPYSKSLLQNIGIHQVTVSGDNRFDKVLQTMQLPFHDDYIDEFKEGEKLLMIGSSWDEDIDILTPLINEKKFWWKVIIAPHDISENRIQHIEKKINKDTLRYSQAANKCLHCHQVMIIDNIGMLSKLYRYAEVAYVGGAFKQGLHNILEPLSYGIPVFCGPKIQKFPEAMAAKQQDLLYPVNDEKEFYEEFHKVTTNESLMRINASSNSWMKAQKGANGKIYSFLSEKGLITLPMNLKK